MSVGNVIVLENSTTDVCKAEIVGGSADTPNYLVAEMSSKSLKSIERIGDGHDDSGGSGACDQERRESGRWRKVGGHDTSTHTKIYFYMRIMSFNTISAYELISCRK